jgi:beta-galactosidase
MIVPRSKNLIRFEISGPGEIIATDNGDPTDMSLFSSKERKAFNGLAMAIVKAKRGQSGKIVVKAKSNGLAESATTIAVR